MSESNVLNPSVFPLNSNLQAIEADAVGKYPFVFLLEDDTAAKLIKLNNNLKALGKDPIDTNEIINKALSSTLDGLLNTHKHPHDELDYYVPQHFRHPKVGDWWNEMGCSYLIVHEVISDVDFIVETTPRKLAGLEPGLYRINRKWLAAMVGYHGGELMSKPHEELRSRDFCAWVRRDVDASSENDQKRQAWYEEHKGEVQDIRHFSPAEK